MPPFYTRRGDDGTTGLLGEGRVKKFDPRMEALGAIDEASAALGLSRSLLTLPPLVEITKQVQRDLYKIMAEIAAESKNSEKFRSVDGSHVSWLEEQTDAISTQITLPKEFILPGDTNAAGALSLARTIVRRAERRAVELRGAELIQNDHLLAYLNRLSSLIFVMEIYEVQFNEGRGPTLAKGQ